MAKSKQWIGAMFVAWLAAGATPALAQSPSLGGGGQHVAPEEIAILWLEGRFRSPITCNLPDGNSVELEESVVFKRVFTAGRASIRATFFGIDGPFTHCSNVVEANIPDRRGTLYLHFRSLTRTDTGVSDFTRKARDGSLTYHVHGGKLRVRALGKDSGEPTTVSFESGDPQIDISVVRRGSDADKLLGRYNASESGLSRPRKRLSFLFRGPDDFHMQAHMIEDESRWTDAQGRRN